MLSHIHPCGRDTPCTAPSVAEFTKRKAALCEKFASDLRLLVESSHQKAAAFQTEYECLPAGSSVAGVWDALKTASEAEADTMEDMSIQLKDSAVAHTELFTSHRKTVKLVIQDMSETRVSGCPVSGVRCPVCVRVCV